LPFLHKLKREIYLSKREYLILLVIIISASVIRLWDVGDMAFNNDEAIYSGQAATLAGFEEFAEHFSIYRAHPLLLQFMVSLLFGYFGIGDTIARIIPALLGIFTIVLIYLIGKLLYDRKVALVSALVLAILAYHIILSRQVLLDVALSFFFTLTLYFMTRHLKSPKDVHWLYLVGASAGLSFLSKEVGLFALITSIVCLFLIKSSSSRNILIVVSSFLLAASPYWIPVLTIEEARDSALSYWNWQTTRDPNLSESFYFDMITQEALGYILTGLFVLSIIYALKTKNIKRPAVFIPLVWLAIPLFIYQFLAVKGYGFLLPLIPCFVLLGVSFLFSAWVQKLPHYRIIIIVLIPLIFIFSGPMLHYVLQIPPIDLVGSGEERYARDGSIWIRDNVPPGAVFLTLDSRTANAIKYYSNNNAFSLHANKNPAYVQINNPDLPILNNDIDHLVYDAHLLDNLPYLIEEEREMRQLIAKYNGSAIHAEYESSIDINGKKLIKPALIIYSLDPIKEE
jgi:4-amino-4-deoxy-L-arabinose transferase-like glycosyltransferase